MPNATVSLSEYLGHILQEIAKARTTADFQVVEIARIYANDEMLKHFPVPRFSIADLELDIPVVVSDIDLQVSKKLVLDQQKFVAKVKEELSNAVALLNRNEVSAMHEDLSDIILDIYALYNIMSRQGDQQAIFKSLHEYYPAILRKTLKKSVTVLSEFVESEAALTTVQIQDLSLTQLHNFVMEHIVTDHSQLGTVLIDPATQSVKQMNSANNIIRIKMKVTEEQVTVQHVTDENGNNKTILNI